MEGCIVHWGLIHLNKSLFFRFPAFLGQTFCIVHQSLAATCKAWQKLEMWDISEIQSARNFHKSRWMEIHTTHNFRIPQHLPQKKVKSTTKDFSISEVKMATNLGKDIFFHRNTCMSESFLSNTSVYLLYLQLAKSKQCKTASGTVWDLWTYSQLSSSLLCFYRKWMKISVPRFDSLPSPPTNKSFQIWFLFIVEVKLTPQLLPHVGQTNNPSKFILSHSWLRKGRNENSLSHGVAVTADSYTASLPFQSPQLIMCPPTLSLIRKSHMMYMLCTQIIVLVI